MENQNDEEMNNNNMSSGGSKDKGGGNYNMCGSRQSSTRWTPTTDQIRILKELYYNNGVRSPSAEQIQRISARLRQYGKIEGKNVFYWFQNHKARERQKKRFISDITPPNHHHLHSFQRSPAAHNSSAPPPPAFHHTNNFNITTNIITPHGVVNACAPSSSTASPGVFAGFGGPVTMEKSLDCLLSAGGSNLGWAAVDPYALYNNNNHEIRRNLMMSLEEEHEHGHEDVDEDDDEVPEIETLPLFPLHNEDINNGCFFNMKPPSSHDAYYSTGWYRPDNDGLDDRALRLSLLFPTTKDHTSS